MKISILSLSALLISASAFADETVAPIAPIVLPTDPSEPNEPEDAPPPPPLLSCAVNGKDISTDDTAIVEAINAQEVCWQAAHVAVACGSGLQGDLQFTAPASVKCQAELTSQRPTASDLQQLKAMRTACDIKWAAKAKINSIYRSTLSYCQLSALVWMVELTNENKR